MIHHHQFVRTGDAEKFVGTSHASSMRSVTGATIVCADLHCVETRLVWPDGTKDVVRAGLPEGELIEQRTLTPQDLETPLG